MQFLDTIYQSSSSSLFNYSGSQTGLGLCAEAGYGIELSDETSLLIGLEFGGIPSIGRTNYYAISVGPLF